jgi:hypothetical protein
MSWWILSSPLVLVEGGLAVCQAFRERAAQGAALLLQNLDFRDLAADRHLASPVENRKFRLTCE